MIAAPHHIPELPFGEGSSLDFTSEAACGEFLAGLPHAPSQFGAIEPAAGFRVKLKSVPLPNVTVLAGSSSPKVTDHLSPRLTLVIPLGVCSSVVRESGREHRWAAPHSAFLIPPGLPVAAESSAGAFVRLDIVESALRETAAGMMGLTVRTPVRLDLSYARTVAMQIHSANWMPVIRSLCSTFDAYACDPTTLIQAGLDDVILRTVAMMLRPDLHFERNWAARPSRQFDLGPLLERITANLGGRVTLSDLEAWSGRSARALQLAFQKRFGMGPMQWIRDQRLELVRKHLLAATSETTIRQVAIRCGLPRMATLIPAYEQRFGELPSDTLRISRR
jgi:AraC-like DNA-binding protein